ncbi:MAG TPA: hypothetical protein VGU66_03375 [Candidatus Elarobacter sp.]|nr:hypothetical protein [Candidatus Elarobacter sp.]
MNQVNALNSQTILNNQKVGNNWISVGWIYLDDGGALWFQKDSLALWTTAFNANFNKYLGITLTPPIGQNPVIIPKPPTTNPAGNNIQTIKCWKAEARWFLERWDEGARRFRGSHHGDRRNSSARTR